MTDMPDIRILFLDMDGTVRYSTDESGFINKPEHIAVYPKAKEQIHRFLNAGWEIAFHSNQGGIALGYTTVDDFLIGTRKTVELLEIQHRHPRVQFCPHDPKSGCICRKPRPGMIVTLLSEIRQADSRIGPVDANRCILIGDRKEDQLCAEACGIPFLHAEAWRNGRHYGQDALEWANGLGAKEENQ